MYASRGRGPKLAGKLVRAPIAHPLSAWRGGRASAPLYTAVQSLSSLSRARVFLSRPRSPPPSSVTATPTFAPSLSAAPRSSFAARERNFIGAARGRISRTDGLESSRGRLNFARWIREGEKRGTVKEGGREGETFYFVR